MMLEQDEFFECLKSNKAYKNSKEWESCFKKFINQDQKLKLVYFAALAQKQITLDKEVGSNIAPLPSQEINYNKKNLELLCRHSEDKNLCKKYFTKNYFGLNFLNMLSESDLKCIRESASESEMDQKCNFTIPRYLVKLPSLYPNYFKDKNYNKLAINLLDAICIADNLSNANCLEMINKIKEDTFLMNELEMRINPDIQKYCYINNIDKPANCMEKYINENKEFKRYLISKVSRDIERLTAQTLLENTNTYFNDLTQDKKEQALRTAKKIVEQQEKYGGFKPLMETFINYTQKNVENFQDETPETEVPYLMKILIKIPQIKSKYIESKSKLLIHKAQNKEDIVDILTYPRFEECLNNYEFSKCKTKHLE